MFIIVQAHYCHNIRKPQLITLSGLFCCCIIILSEIHTKLCPTISPIIINSTFIITITIIITSHHHLVIQLVNRDFYRLYWCGLLLLSGLLLLVFLNVVIILIIIVVDYIFVECKLYSVVIVV